jgi:hypothetical protein
MFSSYNVQNKQYIPVTGILFYLLASVHGETKRRLIIPSTVTDLGYLSG